MAWGGWRPSPAGAGGLMGWGGSGSEPTEPLGPDESTKNHCRSRARAVKWGFGGSEQAASPKRLQGFPVYLPPSAVPLDCVQSSCVGLNAMLQGQSWALCLGKVFGGCCQDGVLSQITSASCIRDHPDLSPRTRLCFQIPVGRHHRHLYLQWFRVPVPCWCHGPRHDVSLSFQSF